MELKPDNPDYFDADGRFLPYAERVERRRVAERDAQRVALQARHAAARPVSDTDRKISATTDHIERLREKLDYAQPTERAQIKRAIKKHEKQIDGWRDEQKSAARQRAFDDSHEAKIARDLIDSCCQAAYPHADPQSIALVKALGQQQWDTPEAMYRAVSEKIEQLSQENIATEKRKLADLEHQRLAADAAAARQKVRTIEAEQQAVRE